MRRFTKEQFMALEPKARRELLSREVIVVSGLINDWPALQRWADPRKLSERLQGHRMRASSLKASPEMFKGKTIQRHLPSNEVRTNSDFV